MAFSLFPEPFGGFLTKTQGGGGGGRTLLKIMMVQNNDISMVNFLAFNMCMPTTIFFRLRKTQQPLKLGGENFHKMIVNVKSNPTVYLGRKVLRVDDFNNEGTFKAMWAAEAWLKENGYSHGSTDRHPNPVGFMHAPNWPLTQKWHNMSLADKKLLDGVIIGNFREGPIRLLFFNVKHVDSMEKTE